MFGSGQKMNLQDDINGDIGNKNGASAVDVKSQDGINGDINNKNGAGEVNL